MTDLAAIVRATRRSARAIDRMARYGNQLRRLGTLGNRPELERAYLRAQRDYAAAQRVLRDNPLPGDA
jgi:hypothetical protein